MRSEILKAFGRTDRPMTLRELKAEVPDVCRADLERLVERGVLHPCSRRRFWDRDEVEHHLALLRARLDERPRSRQDVFALLSDADPTLPRSVRQTLFNRLRSEPGIWLWPGTARHRAPRLATRPPNPEPYVRTLRAQYRKVRERLTNAGLEETAIVEAVLGIAPPRPATAASPPPEPAVLHELAFAWADAPNASVRAPLERVLVNIGAERLGEPNETVRFDGRFHDTEDDLFPDEPALVVEPGWVHGTAQRRVVIVKARVRAAT
ncbi:MAG: hypothetical protein AAGA48_06185 [Myxococcota bacterium]